MNTKKLILSFLCAGFLFSFAAYGMDVDTEMELRLEGPGASFVEQVGFLESQMFDTFKTFMFHEEAGQVIEKQEEFARLLDNFKRAALFGRGMLEGAKGLLINFIQRTLQEIVDRNPEQERIIAIQARGMVKELIPGMDTNLGHIAQLMEELRHRHSRKLGKLRKLIREHIVPSAKFLVDIYRDKYDFYDPIVIEEAVADVPAAEPVVADVPATGWFSGAGRFLGGWYGKVRGAASGTAGWASEKYQSGKRWFRGKEGLKNELVEARRIIHIAERHLARIGDTNPDESERLTGLLVELKVNRDEVLAQLKELGATISEEELIERPTSPGVSAADEPDPLAAIEEELAGPEPVAVPAVEFSPVDIAEREAKEVLKRLREEKAAEKLREKRIAKRAEEKKRYLAMIRPQIKKLEGRVQKIDREISSLVELLKGWMLKLGEERRLYKVEVDSIDASGELSLIERDKKKLEANIKIREAEEKLRTLINEIRGYIEENEREKNKVLIKIESLRSVFG